MFRAQVHGLQLMDARRNKGSHSPISSALLLRVRRIWSAREVRITRRPKRRETLRLHVYCTATLVPGGPARDRRRWNLKLEPPNIPNSRAFEIKWMRATGCRGARSTTRDKGQRTCPQETETRVEAREPRSHETARSRICCTRDRRARARAPTHPPTRGRWPISRTVYHRV